MPDTAMTTSRMAGTDTLQKAALALSEAIQQTPQWQEWVNARKAAKTDGRFARMVARQNELADIQNDSALGRGEGLDAELLVEFLTLQDRIQRDDLYIRRQETGTAVLRLLQEVNEKISQALGLDFASNAAPRRGGCCG